MGRKASPRTVVGASKDFTAPASSRARARLPAAQAKAPPRSASASIQRPFSSAISSTPPSAPIRDDAAVVAAGKQRLAVAARGEDRGRPDARRLAFARPPRRSGRRRRRAPAPARRRGTPRTTTCAPAGSGRTCAVSEEIGSAIAVDRAPAQVTRRRPGSPGGFRPRRGRGR